MSSFKLGRYNGRNNSGNPNDFTFFADSTFSYNYYGSIGKHSSGKYGIRDNRIILNSNISNTTIPVECLVIPSDSLIEKNRVTFSFNLSEEEQKGYKCIPILNNDTLNNKEGIIYFTQGIQIDEKWGNYTIYYTEPIDSIKLWILKDPFIGRPTRILTTKTMYFDKVIGKDITFNLTINDSLFGYRVFDNIELAIKRNKIIFIDIEENKKNALYLRQD
ncbi:hypothetical protein JCM30204_29280 [Dysgonomonas termitidis]